MRRYLAGGMTAALVLPLLAGCATRQQEPSGSIIAAAPVGKAAGATVRSAIMGGSATGAASAQITQQMDRQSQDLAYELPGVTVQRLGGGIVVTFPEGLLFAQESDELTRATRDNLRRFGTSLEKYPNTRIMIVGHTDSQGGRARITTLGRGDAEPLATNDTDAGRQWNRRVEVAIYADEATRFGARE
ncbi:MAG: OmpA family protein [Gemmatimonadales bacterium]|nr:OmpA family protein [Gemmatimonadales bacterium]